MAVESNHGGKATGVVLVLIVGAGPTGLVLALWLTRLGVAVRIIDKTAEAGTTSRALAVQARTLEFYRQIGIADAVVSGSVKIARLNFWVKGRRVAQVPLNQIGEGLSPFAFVLVFPQDAHERLLIKRLNELGVKIERQTELLRFEQNGDGVRAVLRRQNGSEEICETSFLAGCDGASSIVRERLGVGFPGGTYTGLFFVADVEATGVATDQLHVDLEDADFLLVFPLKGTGRVRLVGVVRDLPGGDQGKLTFDDVKGRAIEHLKLAIVKVNWFSTYRVHHRVAQQFSLARVFLLGDAAHIHSPVGGQGMNTGIGDAVNLAWKLAAVLKDGAPVSLLDTYEQERMPFARRLVSTTDRGFSLVTARGFLARFVRARLVPLVMPALFQLPPLRRLMFRTLSQINIDYRQSALSEGKAGAVNGGDRIPWVETAPGQDNFSPLATLNWQVHVYGEPRAGVADLSAEFRLAFHVFPWKSRMRQCGLSRDAIYLIRPDGYVALAIDRRGDLQQLHNYFSSRELKSHVSEAKDTPTSPKTRMGLP